MHTNCAHWSLKTSYLIRSDQSLFCLDPNRQTLLIITLLLQHTWLILCRHFDKKQNSYHAGASVKLSIETLCYQNQKSLVTNSNASVAQFMT